VGVTLSVGVISVFSVGVIEALSVGGTVMVGSILLCPGVSVIFSDFLLSNLIERAAMPKIIARASSEAIMIFFLNMLKSPMQKPPDFKQVR
jgi:hypothetical protein